jgi:ribosome-binding protein aMBF1 (putative translation factor)
MKFIGGYIMIDRKIFNDPIEFFDNLDEELINQIELESILVDIASNIINYRVENGLTQKELAEKLEISQAMVSKLESGDYNPSIEFLFNISKKLGLNLVVELKKTESYEIEYKCDRINKDFSNFELIYAA